MNQVTTLSDQDSMLVEAAVRRTIATYARLVDGRDMEGCAALFTHDARLRVMGEDFAGEAQVRAWLDSLARWPAGIHMTTNTLVTVRSSGEAEAISDVAFIKQVEGAWRIVVAGTYADRLRYEQGAWRFAERVITLS